MGGFERTEGSCDHGRDAIAAGDAAPRDVDALEKVGGCFVAGERDQSITLRSRTFRRAHALAAMLAAAHAGDLAVGVAEFGGICTEVDVDAFFGRRSCT